MARKLRVENPRAIYPIGVAPIVEAFQPNSSGKLTIPMTPFRSSLPSDTRQLLFNSRISAVHDEMCAQSGKPTKVDIKLTDQRICWTKTRTRGTRADRRATGANILQPACPIQQTRADTR